MKKILFYKWKISNKILVKSSGESAAKLNVNCEPQQKTLPHLNCSFLSKAVVCLFCFYRNEYDFFELDSKMNFQSYQITFIISFLLAQTHSCFKTLIGFLLPVVILKNKKWIFFMFLHLLISFNSL